MDSRRTHPALLMLILLAHLVVFWMLARSLRTTVRPRPDTRERITYLVTVPEPRPVLAPPPPRTAARKPAVSSPAPIVQRQRAIAPAPAAAPPSQPAPEPAPPAPPAPPHMSAFDILEQAKSDMPRIERELRNNVPTKLALDKNSMRYKLEHGIEAAYVGGDQRTVVDFYTSPDNAHYMRFTKAGKVWCTMHGGGGVSLRSAMGHQDGDSNVNCPPPDAGWKDMPWVN